MLQLVRFELEELRLMTDQVRRREKIKRQIAKSYEEEVAVEAAAEAGEG